MTLISISETGHLLSQVTINFTARRIAFSSLQKATRSPFYSLDDWNNRVKFHTQRNNWVPNLHTYVYTHKSICLQDSEKFFMLETDMITTYDPLAGMLQSGFVHCGTIQKQSSTCSVVYA